MEAIIQAENHQRANWQLQTFANLSRASDAVSRADGDIIRASAQYTLIGSYNDHELRKGVKLLIAKLSLLYGVADAPDEEHLIVMLDFIRNNYKGYTLEEIYKAGTMNLAGLFSEIVRGETKHKIECYGTISTNFISDLMIRFVSHRNKAHQRLSNFNQSQKTDAQSTQNPGYRNIDYLNGFIAWTNNNGRYPDFWNWKAVYEHLEQNNLFSDTIQQREAFRKIIESGANAELRRKKIYEKDEIKAGSIGAMINSGYYGKNEFHQAYVIRWADQSGLIKKEIVEKGY